jgi:3-phenylpropionate/trans-cinnamate dioxygenase ferredoxin subunit
MCLPATKPVRTHRVEVRGDEVYVFPGVPAGT